MRTTQKPPLKFRNLAIAWVVGAVSISLAVWRESGHGYDAWVQILQIVPMVLATMDPTFSGFAVRLLAVASGGSAAGAILRATSLRMGWPARPAGAETVSSSLLGSHGTILAEVALACGVLALIGLWLQQRKAVPPTASAEMR